ncbi:MAG: peptide ABC transporter substrate-binding protein [Bdellovibrionales bacterium]|nr:peptide ABC transporter substrate-binding protein [Bdellovibrionales bacterium]
MKFNKKLAAAVLLATAWLTPHSSIAAVPTNKELKVGLTQEFENLNPIIKQMLATTYISSFVNRRLNVIDARGKWVPQLVKSIPSLENKQARIITEGGKKKIEADWEVLPNAVWGDGVPVTGHDVEFSWKLAISDNVSVGEKEVYGQVEKVIVDKANPKKFKFIYKEAKWNFNQLGTFDIVPKHLEEPVFKKYGAQKEGYDKNSLYTTSPTTKGLYNGPYVVSEIKLGSHVILTKNPLFYGSPAKIEKVVLKLIPNTGTLEANLRSGTIDMISVLGMTFDQALAFDKKTKSESLPFLVNFKDSLVYEHLDVNLENDILKDVKVRKALVYALDRDQLTKSLFEGKQRPAIHNITPIDPWYTENVVKYPSSKRTAKKLLDEAGWKVGKDGYRYKDGKKLAVNLMTTAGNKVRELVESYLKEEWKQVGVDIDIKNEPPRVYFGETVKKGLYPGLAMFAWVSSPENSPKSQLHSKNIPTKANGYSGQNSGKYSNPKVDALLDKLDVEFTADGRKKLVEQILHFYTDDVPVIPLYYRADVSVTPKNLKGYELTGHQFVTTNHAEYWDLGLTNVTR